MTHYLDNKAALRFKQILAAYATPVPGAPIQAVVPASTLSSVRGKSPQRSRIDDVAIHDELITKTEAISKMRKMITEYQEERIHFKTKILRLEAEVQKKDKQIEDFLKGKVKLCILCKLIVL
jgi:hypothetical protein